MYEVEMKVRTPHGPVRERLGDLDADSPGTVVQEDTYYDAPHRDFAETDEALRVRRESPPAGPETVYLTYKGPLVDEASKTREEAETAVECGEGLVDVLSGVGFEPAATVRKERERFALSGCTVSLDTVEGLGEFVEVETETDADVATAREQVADVLERLGIDPADGIRASYLGLLLSGGDALE